MARAYKTHRVKTVVMTLEFRDLLCTELKKIRELRDYHVAFYIKFNDDLPSINDEVMPRIEKYNARHEDNCFERYHTSYIYRNQEIHYLDSDVKIMALDCCQVGWVHNLIYVDDVLNPQLVLRQCVPRWVPYQNKQDNETFKHPQVFIRHLLERIDNGTRETGDLERVSIESTQELG